MNELDTLAHDIARYGIDRYEDEVRIFADSAFRRGIAPALAGILADTSNPSIVRERAFGRLSAAVQRHGRIGLDSVA